MFCGYLLLSIFFQRKFDLTESIEIDVARNTLSNSLREKG